MPETSNPETHHEKSDVPVRALLWFVVIFIVFAVVVHVLLYGMFKLYVWKFGSEPHPARTAMTMPADANVPQTPRLQPFPSKDVKGEPLEPTAATPVVDMVEMRQQEQRALDNPGWVDKEHGRVRIPIDTAKQLVLQRGMLKVNPAGGTQ